MKCQIDPRGYVNSSLLAGAFVGLYVTHEIIISSIWIIICSIWISVWRCLGEWKLWSLSHERKIRLEDPVLPRFLNTCLHDHERIVPHFERDDP